ncbi:uncharacterized protein LOC144136595 [Amblyomma americanum]
MRPASAKPTANRADAWLSGAQPPNSGMCSRTPIFAALFVVLTVTGARSTPLKDFFESVHKEPLATYQCFRNGTSFEDPSATGLSVLWNGRGLPENKADTVVSFSLPGKERKTSFHVSAEYVPQKDHGILAAEGKNVELYLLLPPHDGKAYFFKQVDTSNGAVSFKIYDTSTSCENAQALRKAVCPEPCSLETAQ